MRYKQFLKIFTNIFISKSNLVRINQNEINMYKIIAYISFFRMDEIRIGDFRQIVMAQDLHKVCNLLKSIFDIEFLNNHVRQQWMNYYDFEYIDQKIIAGIEKNQPNANKIIQLLDKKLNRRLKTSLS